MKKTCALALLIALAGCAVAQNQNTAAFNAYVAENRPLAEQGTIKWSDYFDGLYRKALSSGAPDYALNNMIDLIDFAHQYENGEITKEQFEDRRSAARNEMNGRSRVAARVQAERQQQQQQQQNQNLEAAAALIAAGAQMMQQSRPHTLTPSQASPMMVLPGFLQSQSVSGVLRYCRYSNGVVTTISSIDLCQLNTQ